MTIDRANGIRLNVIAPHLISRGWSPGASSTSSIPITGRMISRVRRLLCMKSIVKLVEHFNVSTFERSNRLLGEYQEEHHQDHGGDEGREQIVLHLAALQLAP